VWRGLTGERSVHLTDWPDPADLPADPGLVAAMDSVRSVCSAALALRKAKGLRVRLPLASLTVAAPDAAALEPYVDLIRTEVNVKAVVLDADVDAHCQRVLSVVPRALGPRLGKDVQRVIRAVKDGDWSVSAEGVVAGGVPLGEGEYELRLVPADADSSATLPGSAGVVVLDTEVTPELAAEGVARDVVRVVQQARRDAGFAVTDRISLVVESAEADVRAAVETHRNLVAGETLASELAVVGDGGVSGKDGSVEVGDGGSVRVSVSRIS
jgi:isoleucyl-tRNA synthetase